MSYILTIIIGSIVGFIAKEMVPTRQNLFLAMIDGATGGLLGLWLVADILSVDPIVSFGTISTTNIFYGIIGSIFFIALTDWAALQPKSITKYEKAGSEIKFMPSYAHQFKETNKKSSKGAKKSHKSEEQRTNKI